MGGVILDFNLKKTVEQEFAPEYHDVIYEHVFGENSVWKTLDEGIYTFDQVIPGILEKLPEELHEKVSTMVTDFYDYMPPFPETCELIKELKENGYLTAAGGSNDLYQWDNGVLLSITVPENDGDPNFGLQVIKFDAMKWRSPLGAYFFSDCSAVWSQMGTWSDYNIGFEMIS